ncbi:hypothetical protein [Chitinophaga sp. MM2321]|uniref:hypothetical protein n=1 Tax=Chitinophaga sp. MM2321 TaxID=3137178 RepID=UPI0032D58C82
MKIFPTPARASSGNNDKAFEAAYGKYYKSLFYLAYLKVKDYSDAGEVVKQVFITAYGMKTVDWTSPDLADFLARKVVAACCGRHAGIGSMLKGRVAPAEKILSLIK